VAENTAVAARLAAEEGPTAAAISGVRCAALYDLRILRRNIQNSGGNETRFICVSKTPFSRTLQTDTPRSSILCTLRHEPGSLAALLDLPAARGVNLTKIENRPRQDDPFTFLFYLDLEADIQQQDTKELLLDMADCAQEFYFLGAYGERQL
jgi:chorismate mutase/prephenate dehydratase